ncbi:hypothetical protein DFH08DRAFT_873954 [Mycena albidolilacea]|uniref:Uncharacterized protein n=1 Tax=Mycena albidolilacea TaxID=1033008 RepID=A0AAD6ZWH6_9AGAR|nr:hypothetical protein DFH08DRAFT_873954 [Mycena albidolilacea]
MQAGRLIRSTITQSDHYLTSLLLNSLPLTPVWITDPATILDIAACGRTSTFQWGNNKLVLPPHLALVFVIKHHTVFDQLAVPTWMWLSICVQTTMREEVSRSPPGSKCIPPWLGRLSNISSCNTFNTTVERNDISAWFQRRVIPDRLRSSVDQVITRPTKYRNRYVPVSLAIFLAAIHAGRSFDNGDTRMKGLSPLPIWSPRPPPGVAGPRHRTASPRFSQPLPDTISHNSRLPTHHSSSPSSPQTESDPESSHPLHKMPETEASSLALPTFTVQNDSAEGKALPDAASSYALRDLSGDSSASHTSGDRGSLQP